MRCCICDYSLDTPSIFHNGTTEVDELKEITEYRGKYYCSPCLAAITDAIPQQVPEQKLNEGELPIIEELQLDDSLEDVLPLSSTPSAP